MTHLPDNVRAAQDRIDALCSTDYRQKVREDWQTIRDYLVRVPSPERLQEVEIAVAQAVEFAEYVEGAAKGKMVERAKHFLSLPYSQQLARRLIAGWKPIDTAPRDGTMIIVGFDSASVWIVRNAWYRDAAAVKEMQDCGSDADETDIGWWSYRHSVTQELLEGYEAPTHWLCETNAPDYELLLAAAAREG